MSKYIELTSTPVSNLSGWIIEGPVYRCTKLGEKNISFIEKSALTDLEQENKKLKKRLASYTHNHITRDIKPRGECPSCDYYHLKQENQKLREQLEVALAKLSTGTKKDGEK